jgi:hypothetical protein
MMKHDEPELSADEFKNRLYSKLKEKGHVDALKVCSAFARPGPGEAIVILQLRNPFHGRA